MTIKTNGFVSAGQFLTGGLDYFTLSTTVNISPTGVYAPYGTFLTSTGTPLLTFTDGFGVANVYANQAAHDVARGAQLAFDRLVTVISTRGQPIIMGLPTWNGSTAYTFRWAAEHRDAWYNLTQGGADTSHAGDATHTPLLPGGTYTPAVPVVAATHPYDAAPDLVTLIKGIATGFTLYPGTSQSDVITFTDHAGSAVSFATATTITVQNALI